MAMGGPWELPRLGNERKFDWRITPLPVKDDVKISASSLGGFHFAVPKGAKEVEGAFQVIELMSDPELFGDAWNQNGLMAPRTDIEVANPAWPLAYAVYREQVKTATPRGPHPQWPSLSRPLQIVTVPPPFGSSALASSRMLDGSGAVKCGFAACNLKGSG